MKIVITGPECSGKTTLSIALAKSIGGVWMEEVARNYLENLNRAYALSDIEIISELHLEKESELSEKSGPLVLDTDLITLEIWADEKFGEVPDMIYKNVRSRDYNFYFLCSPEIPWEEDPLRENPHDRHRLFEVYKEKLISLGKSFTILHGSPQQRLDKALEVLG